MLSGRASFPQSYLQRVWLSQVISAHVHRPLGIKPAGGSETASPAQQHLTNIKTPRECIHQIHVENRGV